MGLPWRRWSIHGKCPLNWDDGGNDTSQQPQLGGHLLDAIIAHHLAYFIWCMFGWGAACGPNPLWLLGWRPRPEVLSGAGGRLDEPIHLGFRV